MKNFVFVLQGHPDNWNGNSPAAGEAIMKEFSGWVEGLGEHYRECSRLRPQMARVTSKNDKATVDGPFTETKEMFSGIFHIQAEDFETAVALARTCPMILRGENILVLPVWE